MSGSLLQAPASYGTSGAADRSGVPIVGGAADLSCAVPPMQAETPTRPGSEGNSLCSRPGPGPARSLRASSTPPCTRPHSAPRC